MIYDGPFSDSVVNKKIEGLEYSNVNENEAKENLLKVLSNIADGDLALKGETKGRFETYDFVAKNLDLIKKAAEGDAEAIFELNRLLAQKHGLVITTTGELDLSNFDLQDAGDEFVNYIKEKYEKGMFEAVDFVTEEAIVYLKPIYDDNNKLIGVEQKTAEAGERITALWAQDVSSISRTTGKEKEEPWKNSFDKFYNAYEKINSLIRQREKLERRYDNLLKKRSVSAQELVNNAKD